MMKISLKLIYQYMAIFFNFPPTSNHLHPLQVENCGSNSRLKDDNGKFRLERVKALKYFRLIYGGYRVFLFEIILNVLVSSF